MPNSDPRRPTLALVLLALSLTLWSALCALGAVVLAPEIGASLAVAGAIYLWTTGSLYVIAVRARIHHFRTFPTAL